MDPRRLLTFRAVAREGSFSGGARALHLSQPSVSTQVAQLEAEVGARLFDRGRGGSQLTRAGELLLQHADQLAWRLELATRQLADLDRDRTDLLRIAAFPTALAGLVPEAVSRIKASQPELLVELNEITGADVEQRLLRGDLDLAVADRESGSATAHDFGDARRHELMQETFLIAMPLAHPLAGGTAPVPLDRFADDHWIVPSTDGFIIQACRAAGFEPHVLSVSSSPLTMAGLVGRGLAVGLVPSLLAHAYDGTALRPVSGPMPRREVFALTPPGLGHPLATEMIQALRDAAAGFAAQLRAPRLTDG